MLYKKIISFLVGTSLSFMFFYALKGINYNFFIISWLITSLPLSALFYAAVFFNEPAAEYKQQRMFKIEWYDFLANGDLRVESARVLGIQDDVIELTLTDGTNTFEVSFPRADIEAMRTALI